MRPRVLFVGRARHRLPLSPTLARRFDALSAELDWRQLGTSADGPAVRDSRFRLARRFPVRRLDGPVFYALLPFRVARELREFRPDAVLAQGAQETALVLLARVVARVPAKVILDLHGDWQAPTRLYGSRLRGALVPLNDLLARVALRRADGIRTISGYTSGLVRARGLEPAAEFPAYMDLAPFLERPAEPLPERPCALFVGVLEHYKAVDVLADAWRLAAPRVPDARLRLVGRGTMADVVERLVADLPEQTTWSPALATDEVARALDEAWVLVLPSRSEGMGRVLVEAFCRGRGVVGSRVGGIPDLVEHDVSGLLVQPGDARELADTLVRVLSERPLAERLAAGANEAAPRWTATPEEFAARMRELVDRVVDRPSRTCPVSGTAEAPADAEVPD